MALAWEEMYIYAKQYYLYHHDLLVPIRFKTNDGFTYDSNGKINLGLWIARQRVKIDPKSERGKKLLMIGMIFNIKDSKTRIKRICVQKKINVELNKYRLNVISIELFEGLINYLEKNNLKLTENGTLNPIFNASIQELEETYNISFDELNMLKKLDKR